MKLPIYMDYHATTPADPRVVEAMVPFFTQHFGNPASRNHAFGWEAEEAVDEARKNVADLIGASAKEVIFTSGATEANHLAIAGVAAAAPPDRRHVVTLVTEHKSVLAPVARLVESGWQVTELAVPPGGIVEAGAVAAAVGPQTALVAFMNRTGSSGSFAPVSAA